MKQLMKLSSLLSMVMLLAMGTMVTSCGGDDDEGGSSTTINKVVLDGKELKVSKVQYVKSDLDYGNNYALYLYFTDNSRLYIQLSGDSYDGKVIDLTKGVQTPVAGLWLFRSWGSTFEFYGDGQYDDPDPLDAGSSMKVTCLNKTTGEFEVQFVAKQNGHTMNGYYKGNFEPVERMTLEGTWEGYTHARHEYNGQIYQSNRTVLTFGADLFRFTKGTGYWVDYYNDYGWGRNYIANHIDWSVKNGIIYIHFREDNFDIQIHNFRLYNDHFVGTIFIADSNIDFSLYKTTAPNWNGYVFGSDDFH